MTDQMTTTIEEIVLIETELRVTKLHRKKVKIEEGHPETGDKKVRTTMLT